MKMGKSLLSTTVVATLLATASMSTSAFDFKNVMNGNINFSIGGYAKLSAIHTDTSEGEISGGSSGTGRTFYVPSTTPVECSSPPCPDEGDAVLDLTARESRINFKANTKVGGHALGMTLEMDFLTLAEGNEVVSNSTGPRMRHYFGTYDNWLFGQTWSTFMDVGALPESVDFLAASEGTVFIRQAQVRYSSGPFQIALENPETWTDIGATDDNSLPDLAANYKFSGDWGHMRLNGLLRQLKVDNPGVGSGDDDTTGWGVGVSGKVKVMAADDVRFAVNYGDGMGRYTSLGLARDAIVDSSGKLDTVESLAAFVAYRHAWTSKTRSSLIYSMADIDNPSSASGSINKESSSIAVNLMTSPVKQVSVGIMYLKGTRETEDGKDGDIDRIQASAKYAF